MAGLLCWPRRAANPAGRVAGGSALSMGFSANSYFRLFGLQLSSLVTAVASCTYSQGCGVRAGGWTRGHAPPTGDGGPMRLLEESLRRQPVEAVPPTASAQLLKLLV